MLPVTLFALFSLGVRGLSAQATANATECGAGVQADKLQQCCPSFLGIHNVALGCLERNRGTGCALRCMLMELSNPFIREMPQLFVRDLISIVPLVADHYQTCSHELNDLFHSIMVEVDFRKVTCDQRIERFLDCMVKSWFQVCPGSEFTDEECVALQTLLKSQCSVLSVLQGSSI